MSRNSEELSAIRGAVLQLGDGMRKLMEVSDSPLVGAHLRLDMRSALDRFLRSAVEYSDVTLEAYVDMLDCTRKDREEPLWHPPRKKAGRKPKSS